MAPPAATKPAPRQALRAQKVIVGDTSIQLTEYSTEHCMASNTLSIHLLSRHPMSKRAQLHARRETLQRLLLPTWRVPSLLFWIIALLDEHSLAKATAP